MLFLSGDVHFGEFSAEINVPVVESETESEEGSEEGRMSYFLEVTSSGMTHKPFPIDFLTRKALNLWYAHRVGDIFLDYNFGVVQTRWNSVDSRVEWRTVVRGIPTMMKEEN